jgi:hypothetical protein
MLNQTSLFRFVFGIVCMRPAEQARPSLPMPKLVFFSDQDCQVLAYHFCTLVPIKPLDPSRFSSKTFCEKKGYCVSENENNVICLPLHVRPNAADEVATLVKSLIARTERDTIPQRQFVIGRC